MTETPQGRSERLNQDGMRDLENQSEDQLRALARNLAIDERGIDDRAALLRAIRSRRGTEEESGT